MKKNDLITNNFYTFILFQWLIEKYNRFALTHKRLNFIIISTIEIDLQQKFNSHFQYLLIFIDTQTYKLCVTIKA